MNANPQFRRMVSEFAIGLMVCAGGYFFLVNPARTQTAKVRAQIDQAQRDAEGTPGLASLTDAQVRELMRVTSERAHEIATRTEPARDEASLFTAVMSLANRHNVRVDQLQPNSSEAHAPTPPPAPVDPLAPPTPAPKDTRTAYTISAVAPYSDLAAFLHSLQNRLGYTVVRSVRVVPAGNDTPDFVHAIIDTEYMAFDLAAVDAQPVKPIANAPHAE